MSKYGGDGFIVQFTYTNTGIKFLTLNSTWLYRERYIA